VAGWYPSEATAAIFTAITLTSGSDVAEGGNIKLSRGTGGWTEEGPDIWIQDYVSWKVKYSFEPHLEDRENTNIAYSFITSSIEGGPTPAGEGSGEKQINNSDDTHTYFYSHMGPDAYGEVRGDEITIDDQVNIIKLRIYNADGVTFDIDAEIPLDFNVLWLSP
jgi:hypothetical protein